MISLREIDLILTIGGELTKNDLESTTNAEIPIIAIGPRVALTTGLVPAVSISTATTGIDFGGSVMRSDGVVLPLRPPLVSKLPGENACIRAIREKLDATSGAKS